MTGTPAGRRITAALVGGAAVTAGAWRFAVLVDHRSQPAYAMPLAVLVIAGVALVAILAGAVAAVRVPRVDITLLSVAAVGLLVFGFLAIFSIGLPILGLGIALTVLLARRLSAGAPRSALISGPLLAIGLVTVAVLAAQLPVVTCERNGLSAATPLWLAGGGASGTGSGSSASDVQSGTLTLNGTTFTYTCARDRLVKFR